MEKKVIIITGASNGIGASLAENFAKKGYCVVINYNKSELNANNLANTLCSKGYNAVAIKADVSNYDQVQNMVKETIEIFGHIDVLINNAGICKSAMLTDHNDNDIKDIISTNLIGTINCSRAVCRHMISRNSGKIINISSIWGNVGASMETVYSATKGGINSFTKALAKELVYSNIAVNAIAPGVVDTNMMKNYSEEEIEDIKQSIPNNKFLSPDDIFPIAYFLAEDVSNSITGQIIQIDGGYLF